MKQKSLLDTNPYLKDAFARKEMIARSVTTSCGVEGVQIDLQKAKAIKIPKKKN